MMGNIHGHRGTRPKTWFWICRSRSCSRTPTTKWRSRTGNRRSRLSEDREFTHTTGISRSNITMSLRYKTAIVGASETTQLGVIPDMSETQLHIDAAHERHCRPRALTRAR